MQSPSEITPTLFSVLFSLMMLHKRNGFTECATVGSGRQIKMSYSNLNAFYVRFKMFVLLMIVWDIIIFPFGVIRRKQKREKDFPEAEFAFIMAVLLFILPIAPSLSQMLPTKTKFSFDWHLFVSEKISRRETKH